MSIQTLFFSNLKKVNKSNEKIYQTNNPIGLPGSSFLIRVEMSTIIDHLLNPYQSPPNLLG